MLMTTRRAKYFGIAAIVVSSIAAAFLTWRELSILKTRTLRQQREIEAMSLMLSKINSDDKFPSCVDSVATISDAVRYCGLPNTIFLYHEYVTYLSYLDPCDDGVLASYDQAELLFTCKGDFVKGRNLKTSHSWVYFNRNTSK